MRSYHGKKNKTTQKKRGELCSEAALNSKTLNEIEEKFRESLQKIALQEETNWEISKYEQKIQELTK